MSKKAILFLVLVVSFISVIGVATYASFELGGVATLKSIGIEEDDIHLHGFKSVSKDEYTLDLTDIVTSENRVFKFTYTLDPTNAYADIDHTYTLRPSSVEGITVEICHEVCEDTCPVHREVTVTFSEGVVDGDEAVAIEIRIFDATEESPHTDAINTGEQLIVVLNFPGTTDGGQPILPD